MYSTSLSTVNHRVGSFIRLLSESLGIQPHISFSIVFQPCYNRSERWAACQETIRTVLETRPLDQDITVVFFPIDRGSHTLYCTVLQLWLMELNPFETQPTTTILHPLNKITKIIRNRLHCLWKLYATTCHRIYWSLMPSQILGCRDFWRLILV
jgi:hypothetical protein